jgi:glutamate racemase
MGWNAGIGTTGVNRVTQIESWRGPIAIDTVGVDAKTVAQEVLMFTKTTMLSRAAWGGVRAYADIKHPTPTESISSGTESPATPVTGTSPSNLDRLLGAYNVRGVENFFNHGGAEAAAKVLDAAEHVMLVTGFNVAQAKPETDGPPGAAALGHALRELRKVVTFVTDGPNKPILRAAVEVLNPKFARYGRFVEFNPPHGPAGDRQADALIATYRPDAVVAIELPARTADGGPPRNMRGVDIKSFNPPLDGLLLSARKRGITTVGVGDGGNEAGMGGLPGIPKALDGSEMASAVPADHPVTAWNSNFGAEAIAGVLLARNGKLDKLHTPEQQTKMIVATLAAGAVDGVTRKNVAGSLADDGKSQTGVDGFSPQVHAGMLELMRNVVQGMDVGFIAKQTPHDDKPFLIGAFDSSNGGLIAARNLANFLENRSSHRARFVILVDHGNAPYGEKTRDPLIKLVADGLKTAEKIGVDVIAMACNTACTAFPEALGELQKTKVLDLIEVTAKAIAREGGNRPVILSTPATAKDPCYPNKICEASEGAITSLVAIGAKEWAPLINRLDHLSSDSAVQASVDRAIKEYVEKIPADATSVWLCCTHYPALKERIEEALKKRGSNIKVIDPMEYQAEAIIEHLNAAVSVDRSKRNNDTSPIVVTTGDNIDVSAKALLGRNDTLVLRTGFGREFNMTLIRPYLDGGASGASSDSAARWQSRGPSDRHPGSLIGSGTPSGQHRGGD